MFRIRLVLNRTADRFVFRVGRTFRVVNAVTAVALVGAGLALGTLTLPLMLAALALVGALYEESAAFDRTTGRVEFRIGLVFWARVVRRPLAEVSEIRVTSFGAARFTGLEVGFSDGTVKTIENDRGKPSADRLAAWGRDLADWLGVPLTS